MFKIIYTDSEFSSLKPLMLSDEEMKQVEKNMREAKMNDFFYLTKSLRIQKKDIRKIEQIHEKDYDFQEQEEQKKYEKTRFEINPPSKDVWQKIALGVMNAYPQILPNPRRVFNRNVDGLEHTSLRLWSGKECYGAKIFKSAIASVWNANNQWTKDIIEEGTDLFNRGETLKTMWEKIVGNTEDFAKVQENV